VGLHWRLHVSLLQILVVVVRPILTADTCPSCLGYGLRLFERDDQPMRPREQQTTRPLMIREIQEIVNHLKAVFSGEIVFAFD
jgi:hypothetical protein